MKRWYYSLLLMVAYVLIFHLWNSVQDRNFWIISGVIWAGVMTALAFRAYKQGYFLSRTDVAIHGFIILDILLEAILITNHQDNGFYYCAVGFLIVVAAYRWHVIQHRLPRQSAESVDKI